ARPARGHGTRARAHSAVYRARVYQMSLLSAPVEALSRPRRGAAGAAMLAQGVFVGMATSTAGTPGSPHGKRPAPPERTGRGGAELVVGDDLVELLGGGRRGRDLGRVVEGDVDGDGAQCGPVDAEVGGLV